MRTMTSEEQKIVLEALSSALWSASMENMDDVLYGSIQSCEKSGREMRAVERIIKAVPKDIIDAFNKSLRKAKADKLREQADRIEKETP